ncbi:MAG: ribokinase [Chloroflexi bacterium]|nr:ribokinase [Chloroflexota bacterium]
MSSAHLLAALDRFAPCRVLVVGDLALDEYLIGRATRLSREAPIPVLELDHEFTVPGGAGNPAQNLAALGALAVPVGVVGADANADRLTARFRTLGVDTGGLVADPSRPTTTKTRILAEGAMPTVPLQVARLDRIRRDLLDAPVERELIERIEACAEGADALLVSDYRSGLVTPAVIAACVQIAQAHKLLLTVDSQGDLMRFSGFDLVRANRQETEQTLGRALVSADDFRAACEGLLRQLAARVVVITRAGEGLSIGTRDGRYAHVPAVNVSEVYDVTGAGDTVIAVLTLALACGVDPLDAAQIATYAAGIVVKHIGVAVVTVADLKAALAG